MTKAYIVIIISVLFIRCAFGETMKITTFYPIPYASYNNAKVKDALAAGTVTISSATKIYGDVTINNGSLTIKDGFLRIDPNAGPYGADGFRVSRNGNVAVGSNVAFATTARLKAHTVIAGRNLYALDYNSAFLNKMYGQARGFTDPSELSGNLRYKAQMRAMFDNGTPVDFADDNQYAPFRIDGYYVRLGEKAVDMISTAFQGNIENILIGTKTPDPAVVPSYRVFLQVGNPGDGSEARGDFRTYSSRAFKSDITPFTIKQYDQALSKISKTPVWHYNFKEDKKGQKTRMGLISENSPAAMVTVDKNALSLSDTFGYLAAAMKDLKIKNDALRKRLGRLERTKIELEAKSKS